MLPPCQHYHRGFSRVPCNTCGTGGSFPLPAPASPRGLPLFLEVHCTPASPEPCGMQGRDRAWGRHGHLGHCRVSPGQHPSRP